MSVAHLCANTMAGDLCVYTEQAGEAGGRQGEGKKIDVIVWEEL